MAPVSRRGNSGQISHVGAFPLTMGKCVTTCTQLVSWPKRKSTSASMVGFARILRSLSSGFGVFCLDSVHCKICGKVQIANESTVSANLHFNIVYAINASVNIVTWIKWKQFIITQPVCGCCVRGRFLWPKRRAEKPQFNGKLGKLCTVYNGIFSTTPHVSCV